MIIIIVKYLFLKKICKYYGVDVDDYEFFDEDYENYDYEMIIIIVFMMIMIFMMIIIMMIICIIKNLLINLNV